MLNRIRVVTMLMMVLVVFALLQLVSGGLLFSSLKQNQQSFADANDLRQQQTELTKTWELMLQTRINLSRSSARMMDGSGQSTEQRQNRSVERAPRPRLRRRQRIMTPTSAADRARHGAGQPAA
ncbi:methyl-accepting chemotaxis protein II [Pseudescherichia vulneris]|nr:methyl-accepting chemotaxis protein II [Pseudescherichia vulneris]